MTLSLISIILVGLSTFSGFIFVILCEKNVGQQHEHIILSTDEINKVAEKEKVSKKSIKFIIATGIFNTIVVLALCIMIGITGRTLLQSCLTTRGPNKIMSGTHTFTVCNQQFEVPKRYQLIRPIGYGAYGAVCAARDTETGQEVAIKRIGKVFERKIITKRTLRELKLLRHFNSHENIITILDVLKPKDDNFEEIYVIQELMEADLHQIIKSGQTLTDSHYQYFIYQILRGLKYMHSANVLHRDLKPGNLLVNSDCELKIIDFGLARGFTEKTDENDNIGFMTEYVATRWYRAPEIMLSFKQYTKAIDIWSVGCIFAELLGSQIVDVHQLNLILSILGTPSEESIRRIKSPKAQEYVMKLPKMPKVPFSRLFPKATPVAIDFLEKLLEFDPIKRITVDQALKHPYLSQYHDPNDEPNHIPFDFSFESADTIPEIKELLVEEIMSYHTTGINRMKRNGAAREVLTQVDKTTKSVNEENALVKNKIPESIADLSDEDLENELCGVIPSK
ncbi:Pkinase-domain-containing protein [Rozella allomycis CSF55]|uniref:Mitogen-activated protein kinase n=1 Tax=Rozella allomycis (strain CSF55) TaxID=988480 RepID=A0A075ARD8_ROZAC|nr:Protein kinase, catalytic domain-containing protein [Rozella allomycis CSF55]RKP19091.1 Pkinase-domain-containing protein [Rozella allomycis CSF55]|eukprot:EPZ32808.1 Protein kinase, catalytic domain-containing protein [Rozella allomycis CSF55]